MTIQSHSREGGNPLPEGWATTNLEMLTTDISYGYTASSSAVEVGPKMLRITDIQDNSVAWSEVPYCEIEGDKIDKYLLKKNDLVFARTGATVGKSFLIKSDPPKAVYASYLIRVRTASTELISLLNHFFNSHQYWQQITEFSAGIGQPNVNGTKLKGLAVTLPPLAEQKVISDKLDILLAQVETTKTRLDRIPQILKTFRQSVLAAAVSGKLTEEWREDNGYSGFSDIKLEKLIAASANGLSKRSGKDGEETTILRLADFKDASRSYGKERKIKLNAKEVEKYSLINDDILIIRVNGSIDLAGKFIRYEKTDETEGFCDHFIRLRLDENKVLSKYLVYVANEGSGRLYLQNSLSTSAGQNTINQGSVKGLDVPLPTLKEQTEIVRRVEELFAFADSIEQKSNAALERVNNLTQSILAKAFRGELTADWRAANPDLISGDNSAEALLAKIKAEREAKSPKKKVKTKKAKG